MLFCGFRIGYVPVKEVSVQDREHEAVARFLNEAIQHFKPGQPARTRVLDFGCGAGVLADSLAELGYSTAGCDIDPYWDVTGPTAHRLRIISRHPYRIPFEDQSFDVVVSTSVLEHAQNKTELFAEINRVLAPTGVAMHLYPSKWYLPTEPHIYVPLVNMFWPNCPRWWLSLWAWLGVRNEYQTRMRWQDVRAVNERYCHDGLSYWSHRAYRRLSMDVFGNYHDATAFFAQRGYGGVVRLSQRLRMPASVAGLMSSTFRMSFLVNRKSPA
jgi:SAM-dependent methyltransferase